MNLLHCYEILGLRVDAELPMIKASYRRLARRFHPDVNGGDRHAQEKFIEINRAYRELMRIFPNAALGDEAQIEIPRASAPHRLTALEHRLKWQTYRSLQACLRQEKFARAIALTDGLAHRLPNDVEVRQWQGIIYLSWGSLLLRQGKQHQARTYFRRALLADPCNVTLRQQVEKAIAKIKIPAV